MRIDEYPRPKADNRRGIHWSASIYHPSGSALDYWIAELQAMKIKWVKVLDDGGGSSQEIVQRLVAADIMPVVRLYRQEPNPGCIGAREEETVRRLVAAGARYFETNNEPDLGVEWKGGSVPANWLDVVVDNFIVDAGKVLGLGGLPALPALAVGNRTNIVEQVVKRGRADLFQKGAWIAVHNYLLNHPLDYPYDPVNQQGQTISQAEYDTLGAWAWEGVSRDQVNQWRASDKNPGATVANDPSCFLGFQLADQQARAALGFPVPIISTEGGPVVGWREDRRYPRVTPNLQRDRVVGIAKYMQGTDPIHGENCPSNFFAMCHWLISNAKLGYSAPGWESQAWYTDFWKDPFGIVGELPVVGALKALPSVAVGTVSPGSAAITGKVLRADTGEALPGLLVQLLTGTKQVGTATTAADGGFTFSNLTAGAYDLFIDPFGVVAKGVSAVQSGGQAVIIRLAGGRASVLSGSVQTAAGAAVAGVAVRLLRDGQALAPVTSGADGSFRFGDLTLGNYRLSVPGITVDGIALDGWQSKSLKLTTGVAAGYKYAVDKKRLLPPEETNNRHLFYGFVTDALGAPLNGIKIQMSWTGADPGTNWPSKVSGSDPYKPAGYYEFLHTPGTFALQIVQGDWPSDCADNLETAKVPGREGQAITYEVNFRVQAAGGAAQVDGVVNGGTAGKKVTLAPAAGTTPAARQAGLATNGAFAFPNTAVGAYQLSLEDVGVVASDIAIKAGDLFKVLVALRSRLAGKVIAPPPGLVAVLYAPPAWGWTRQVPLATDGSFAFENLPPGRYRLEVGGQVLPDLALNGENKLTLAAIDLAAGRSSVLRGRIADVTGQPRADRAVTLKREGLVVAETKTAADGTYRFANLPAGKYNIEVAGLGVVASNLALDGEHEVVADVLWPKQAPSGILQGRVLNPDGSTRPFAVVRLIKDAAEVQRVESDAKGGFKFTALAAGKYALAVGDGEPLVKDIAVSDDASVVRDVTVPAGPAKALAHYVLFAPAPAAGQAGSAEARVLLLLAMHYLKGDVAGGFSLEQAKSAKKVTIVGARVPATAESTLSAAGCQVARLSGDGYAVVKGLANLFAEG